MSDSNICFFFVADASSVRATMFIGSPRELRFSPNLLDFLATAVYGHQAALYGHRDAVRNDGKYVLIMRS